MGKEFSDEEISAEIWRRQKVKVYHEMKTDIPQLFDDPNKNQPEKQYQIQDLDKLIVSDKNPDGLISHELLTKPVLDATESQLAYYFPWFNGETIKQVLSYTRKNGIATKLNEIIAIVEEEFERNQTNGLFRKWLIDDKQAQEIIRKLQEPDETKTGWLKKNFVYANGILYKQNLIQPTRHGISTTPYRERSIYVPNTFGVRETVLRNYHGTLATAHPGTTELI